MGQTLEEKLTAIRIRIDQLTDDDVKKFVENYPLFKKYYSKLSAVNGDCKRCGCCCVGGDFTFRCGKKRN